MRIIPLIVTSDSRLWALSAWPKMEETREIVRPKVYKQRIRLGRLRRGTPFVFGGSMHTVG
jgi:hypothetical protein